MNVVAVKPSMCHGCLKDCGTRATRFVRLVRWPNTRTEMTVSLTAGACPSSQSLVPRPRFARFEHQERLLHWI